MESNESPPTAEALFGAAMKAHREGRGCSQQVFADRMNERGFSWRQSTVAKTEAGERPIRVNEAVAIGEILGVRLLELLRDYDAETVQGLRRILDSNARIARLEREKSAAATALRTAQHELKAAREEHAELRREMGFSDG